ncbi:hypothetical protein GOP47_0022593 [Adiantum capillus-veneris]|uniref:Uncharacterized protein n=1 Tax=Adiantum capillus-veneris TaxID=13818 RepID=A0A9D4U7M8_ADICA|nr:hypothetical protein GOP47_0022593 [Adiantum capillus-veneris]
MADWFRAEASRLSWRCHVRILCFFWPLDLGFANAVSAVPLLLAFSNSQDLSLLLAAGSSPFDSKSIPSPSHSFFSPRSARGVELQQLGSHPHSLRHSQNGAAAETWRLEPALALTTLSNSNLISSMQEKT